MSPTALAGALWIASAPYALAAAMNRPFAVGGYEGGGPPTGLTGWLLAEQSELTRQMAAHLHRMSADPQAFWGLVGLGLLYGVFHAAGPGHGKAVIASYMMASDRAVRRGALLAFLSAALQGAVAIALVGVAALVFNATATQMNVVADALARLSYAGIAAIGVWLVWRKGRALFAAVRVFFARRAEIADAALFAGAVWRPGSPGISGDFRTETPGENLRAEDECGHAHAPDPQTLGDGRRRGFAAVFRFDSGARVLTRPRRVSRRHRRDGGDLAGNGSDDRRARLRRRLRENPVATFRRGRKFARQSGRAQL